MGFNVNMGILQVLRRKCVYLARVLDDKLNIEECEKIRKQLGGPSIPVLEYAASTLIAQLIFRVNQNSTNLSVVSI